MADIESISSGLKFGEDGIWQGADSQDISYPADGNEACFAVEDNSFWFRHRNDCIIAAVKAYPPEDKGTIFDVGGGNGFVSLALANSGFDVALVEPGRNGASNAKRRGVKTIICATTDSARFKPHSLSAVGLFDVVEHIENDLSFLTSCRNLMKQGGRLYLTVPAYSYLWSQEDVSAGHFKRYTLKGICGVLESAGFELEFASYIFRFLPIPIALFRALPYRLGLARAGRKKSQNAARDHVVKGGVLANIFSFFLKSEVQNIRKGHSMSFGGSCLVVARNRGASPAHQPKEALRRP